MRKSDGSPAQPPSVRNELRDERELRELFGSIRVPREVLNRRLPEWLTLEKWALEFLGPAHVEVLGHTRDGQYELPLLGFVMGNPAPEAPVLGLFGGVHGLERIGSQVVLSLMNSFGELYLWDHLTREALRHIRIVFFPMINPLGILHQRRANPNGVDLMRNSLTESKDHPTWLVGGHRISPRLPWYRGIAGAEPEPESRAVFDFARRHVLNSPRAITVDFHSGFGTTDQIWFPYAKTRAPFAHLPELHALKEAFERSHPHHFYKIEPQAKNYTTHGDLWDQLYDEYRENPGKNRTYLPLALEMGSWLWVKKNPLQIFSPLGPFNPIVPHRLKRILRRHNTLFDFLVRALVSGDVWLPKQKEQREKHRIRAEELWYGPSPLA